MLTNQMLAKCLLVVKNLQFNGAVVDGQALDGEFQLVLRVYRVSLQVQHTGDRWVPNRHFGTPVDRNGGRSDPD